MKKAILIVCGLLLSVAGLQAQGQRQSTEETTIIKAGMNAPSFTVKMLDGSQVNTDDLRGKVVLVNFWATWCPPCREEFTRMQSDVVDRFAGEEFVLLAISRGEKYATVKDFMVKNDYKFLVGLDEKQEIFSLFASNYIPRNFVIGKDGIVVSATVGYTPEEFDHMLKLIELHLKK